MKNLAMVRDYWRDELAKKGKAKLQIMDQHGDFCSGHVAAWIRARAKGADFWKKNIDSKETFIDEAYEGKVVYQDTSAKFRSKVELVHKKPEDYMLKKSKKGVNVLEKVEEKYEGVGQVGLLAMYSTDNGKFLIDLAKNYKGRLIEIGLFLGPSHSVGLDTTNSPTSIVFFDPACGEMETSCEDFCAMVKATWQWWGYKDYTATFYRPVG